MQIILSLRACIGLSTLCGDSQRGLEFFHVNVIYNLKESIDNLTRFLTVYKFGISWSPELSKVPQIKMEDRPPFDIGTKNWAPAHGLHSTVKISDSARRSQLLRAGHHRAWHLILICHFKLLEERWANLAQLFTFYWDLTRNKFSFPLNAFLTRSPSLIKFYSDAILESSRKLIGIVWSTGQDSGLSTRKMEGLQTPGADSIRHITCVWGGDIPALFRN